jgi:hypothetical protein
LFTGVGFHPFGGSVFEERSPQGLSFFPTFPHHYRSRNLVFKIFDNNIINQMHMNGQKMHFVHDTIDVKLKIAHR